MPESDSNNDILGCFTLNEYDEKMVVEKATGVLLETTVDMLKTILQFASKRCRRDYLWDLIFNTTPCLSKRNGGEEKDSTNTTMTMSELKELLSHVHIDKLEDATQNLKELADSYKASPVPNDQTDWTSTILEWQHHLIKILQEKYWQSHCLISSENHQFQVNYLNSNKYHLSRFENLCYSLTLCIQQNVNIFST